MNTIELGFCFTGHFIADQCVLGKILGLRELGFLGIDDLMVCNKRCRSIEGKRVDLTFQFR